MPVARRRGRPTAVRTPARRTRPILPDTRNSPGGWSADVDAEVLLRLRHRTASGACQTA
jgi:hypothetical protein